MKALKPLAAALVSVFMAGAAHADITIGISLPLTGPASGLGIPVKNGISLWPTTIAGEKLNVIILDDASDPTAGVKNVRRFVTEDKVDLIGGSAATPVALAMSDVAAEAKTVQIAYSPVALPPGKGDWTFRIAQSSRVMSVPIVEHWKKTGVKTFGFLGYSDAYGEAWIKDIQAVAEASGIKMIAAERFARTDTSVTGQVLKLVSAKPDAMLVVASGSGAAMPHKALVERGFAKDKIYQTHSAASMDLMRVGGKDVEGSYVVSGPALLGDLLPANHPSKPIATKYVEQYEKQFGKNMANNFAAHSYDTVLLLEKVVPIALKKAKPGTPEFRAALRDAIHSVGPVPVSQGTLHYTDKDHFGFQAESQVLVKVVNGDWQYTPTK